MDTKHINDPIDATAIEAKELSAQQEIRDDGSQKSGASVLRLVVNEESAGSTEADTDTGQEELAPPKREAPRGQYAVHRLAGRTVFRPRSRR